MAASDVAADSTAIRFPHFLGNHL